MDADAGQSDQAEQQEADGDGVVGQLRHQQRGEIERDLGVDLALAVQTFAKHEWQFGDPQAAMRRRHDVEQDLEPLRRQPRRQRLEAVAPHHEEAAHRVAEIDAEEASRERARPAARAFTVGGQARGGTAGEISAGDDEIDVASAQAVEHGDEQCLVVLQVGVHHGDIIRLARQHAFEARAREPPAADAADAAHAIVRLAERARNGRCAVGGIVVDEHHLPLAARQNATESLDQNRHVVALLEGRHDNAELRRRPCRRTWSARRQRGCG